MIAVARSIILAVAFVVVGVLLAPTRPAAEAPYDAFLVKSVDVDAEAEDATKARDQAMEQGRMAAFQRLLRRLTMRVDHGRLPEIDPAALIEMVDGIEVRSEKSSRVRYVAQLAIRFKADGVRAFLRTAQIPFVETPSKPTVLLAIYQRGRTKVLWDAPNPWRQAWSDITPPDGLVQFALPFGDLTDLQAIDAAQAADGDVEALARISARYGAGGVLVAVARESAGGKSNSPRLEVTLTRFDTGTREIVVAGTLIGAAGNGREATFRATAELVAVEVEERWKRDNMTGAGGEEKIVAAVPITGFSQWIAVRKRLASVSMVRGTNVLSLSRERVLVEIRFAGSFNQFRRALGQNDLILTQYGATVPSPTGASLDPTKTGTQPDWILAVRDRPEPVQPTPEAPPPDGKPGVDPGARPGVRPGGDDGRLKLRLPAR